MCKLSISKRGRTRGKLLHESSSAFLISGVKLKNQFIIDQCDGETQGDMNETPGHHTGAADDSCRTAEWALLWANCPLDLSAGKLQSTAE